MTESIVPMFMYGTLRAGCGLHYMVQPVLAARPYPAMAKGFSLWTNSWAHYPFLLQDSESSHVTGDLLLVHDGPELKRVVQMEVNAGYTARKIEVSIFETGETRTVHAWAFVLEDYFEQATIPILSGDWVEWNTVDVGLEEVETIPVSTLPS